MTQRAVRISKRFVSNLIQIGATKMPRALGHTARERFFADSSSASAQASAKKIGMGLSVGAEQ